MFVIDLRNTAVKNYTFSVVGNKNVDIVYIYSRFTQYANKNIYLKLISENYADKIQIANENVSIKDGCLVIKWVMGAVATVGKKLQIQLSFEDGVEDIIAQSSIATITLGDTLDPSSQIEPLYPTVLQQLQEQIDVLHVESVANITASFENGVLVFDWYNADGTHLGTQIQIELPTEECYVSATWNDNGNQKIILSKNNGQTTELDLSNIFTAIGNVQSNLDTHEANKNNPHEVTKAQVGLGNADNTSDLNKPVSTAQQEALDLKANKSVVDAHISNTSNPHNVTKAQVGLGDVVNTGDSDTPVENGTTKFTTGGAYTELAKKQNVIDNQNKLDSDLVDDTNQTHKFATSEQLSQIATNESNIASHTSNTSNPHSVTKAQVGLGNVDNTSDADKPVSTAQQTALDLKADKSTTYTKTQTDDLLDTKTDKTTFNAHVENTSNPHSVTKAQVGLGNADNTSDLNKPISTATQTALDNKVDKVTGKGLSTNDFTDAYKDNVDDNTLARHTHSNKALLDTYEQTEENIADAVSKKHSHSNKALLDTYDQTNANIKTAVDDAHTHSNKAVLDATTVAFTDDNYVHTDNNYTSAEKTKLGGIETGAQVNVLEGVQVNGTDLTIASKKVNIDLTGKVDKVSGNNKVYGTDGSGNQTSYDLDNGTGYSGNVARRDTNGQVHVPQTPTANDHATSKKYVDDVVSTVKSNAFINVNTTTYPTLNDFLASSGEEGYVYLYPINTSDITKGYYQYIWESSAWQSLGTTKIDLSDYYTKTQTDNLLSNKADKSTTYTKTETDTLLVAKQNTIDNSHKLSADLVDDANATNKFVSAQDKSDIASNTSARHTHSNKALLDTYEQTEVNLADAVSKKHSHANKSLLDTYEQTETDLASAVSLKHSHSNKTILDNTTASYTSEEASKLSGIDSGAQVNVIETIKVNGTAQTVSSKAVDITVPTNNNQLTNGAGYITGINSSDVTTALGYTPYDSSNPNGYTTNVGTITGVKMNGEVKGTSGIVDLGNVATAEDFYTKNQTDVLLGDKVDKVTGKGLSTNDFTTAYKDKLDGIESGAQVNTVSSVNSKTGAVSIGASLSSSSTSGTGKVEYLEDVSYTSASASGSNTVSKSTHTHTVTPTGSVTIASGNSGDVTVGTSITGASHTPTGSVGLTANTESATGRITYIEDISSTGASASGSDTFVKGINGGSGSYSETTKYLSASFIGSSATSGTPSGTTTVASSGHTHSVTASGSVGLSANSENATGRITYVESFNAGTTPPSSASPSHTSTTSGTPSGTTDAYTSLTTKYAHFNAGTTPPSSASFSGSATTVVTGVSSVTNPSVTISSGNSGDVSVGTSISGASYTPSGSVTLTGTRTTTGSGTSARRKLTVSGSFSGSGATITPTLNTTYISASASGTSVSLSTGSYTPSGSVSLTSGTAPSFEINTTESGGSAVVTGGSTTAVASSGHTHAYDKTTSVSLSGGTAPSVTTKFLGASFSGSAVTSGTPSATESVASSSHTHDTTANGSISLTANGESATGRIKYVQEASHSHTGASVSSTGTAVTGVTGGTTSATTKYMSASFSGDNTTITPTLNTTKISASFSGNSNTTSDGSNDTATAVSGISSGSVSKTTKYLDVDVN